MSPTAGTATDLAEPGRVGSAGLSPVAAKGTQAIDRAAALVSTVVYADEPLSFVDLHEEVGLPKSTTSRLLAALERTDLLERDDAGNYVAGPLFWLYAARHDPFEELVRISRPTLRALGEDTRETVHLAVARGDRVVHLAQVDSQFMLGTRDWTEVDVPAYASALGKVLHAYGRIELPPTLASLTPRTITDPAAVAAQAERIRRDGAAVTVDELEVGLSGIAVPLHGPDGTVLAAIGVSGPTVRLTARTAEVTTRLKDRAEELTELLSRRNRKEGAA